MKFFYVFMFLVSFNLLAEGDVAGLKKKMGYARETLLTLVKDATKRDQGQQKLVADSANEVSTYLETVKVAAGKAGKWDDFKKTWKEFKTTREKELVPAVLGGKQAEAEKIANGIQKERLDKMNRLLDDISGKDL